MLEDQVYFNNPMLDKIYEALYPVRLQIDDCMSVEEVAELRDHFGRLRDIINDMEGKIRTIPPDNEVGNKEKNKFYESLLHAAEKLVREEHDLHIFAALPVFAALQIAAIVIAKRGYSDHAMLVFESFNNKSEKMRRKMVEEIKKCEQELDAEQKERELRGEHWTFEVNVAWNLFNAAATIPFYPELKNEFHSNAAGVLADISQKNFPTYHLLLMKALSVVGSPDKFPGAMVVIQNSYEQAAEYTDQHLANLIRYKVHKINEHDITPIYSIMRLAADITVYHREKATLSFCATDVMQKCWEFLTAVKPDGVSKIVDELQFFYDKLPYSEHTERGRLDLLSLLNCLDPAVKLDRPHRRNHHSCGRINFDLQSWTPSSHLC